MSRAFVEKGLSRPERSKGYWFGYDVDDDCNSGSENVHTENIAVLPLL